MGVIDEVGLVRTTDRLKDLIIRGAESIYPAEIEAGLLKHPQVLDVAVFGAPDNKWGEVVAAVIQAGRATDTNRADPGEEGTMRGHLEPDSLIEARTPILPELPASDFEQAASC